MKSQTQALPICDCTGETLAPTSRKNCRCAFRYDYKNDEIAEVAKRSKRLARDAREVHVVFNNNALDYAPRAAARLRAALGQIVPALPQTPELF